MTLTELEEYDDDEDEDESDYQGETRELEFSVTLLWDGEAFSVALEHIFPLDADLKTLEAVLD